MAQPSRAALSIEEVRMMLRSLRIVGLALMIVACGSEDPPADRDASTRDGSSEEDAAGQGPTRAEVLEGIALRVVTPRIEAFRETATTLATAFEGADAASRRASAQDAWKLAMNDWQFVEMMQVGPIGAMDTTSGGEDRRDHIYAWPIRNLCAIDQRTVSEGYNDADALGADLVSLRGLGAIEYLLFVDSNDNNCSPLSPINAEGTWATFSEEEIATRRLEMAKALARLVHDEAQALSARWRATNGNFIREFLDPTRSGALYGSAQEGLNAVSDAMFYLDKETKDMKLAEPAGILGCEQATCPETVELSYSQTSVTALSANLVAFQWLYQGGEEASDVGFDDLLVAMGAEAFAQSMATHIGEAIAAVEKIDGPLAVAVESDAADVAAAHVAVKVVTDDLKTMFVTVLDLEVPNRAAGDND